MYLFYRLNVFPIEVPPLNQRIEDIPILVETFLEDFATRNRSRRKQVTTAALDILCGYPWPGNIRELKNLVERLLIIVDNDTIDTQDIPEAYTLDACREHETAAPPFFQIDDLKKAKLAFEKEFINRKLVQYRNNITRTAQAIGVGRSYLHKKIKMLKNGFTPPE